MIRNVDLDSISDGRRYASSDLARLGCHDCSGCSACCQGMSDTIVLDPYDIYQLTLGIGCSFEQLLSGYVKLQVIDGVILPVLAMNPQTDRCNFLDQNGRCKIHKIRPGICRLFPLGRIYENGTFSYFLQKDECKKTKRYDVRIDHWIGVKPLARYEKFVADWHYAMKDLGDELAQSQNAAQVKKIQMMLLQLFYVNPYDGSRDFYEQYEERMAMIR